jgi:cation transport regulator ChaC
VLDGRPSDEVWYFAYGSNMHEETFVKRRDIEPLERRVGRIKNHRLRFNLEGRPKGKAAPANICLDADQEVWGVLYKITRRDLLRLNSTEGIPGRGYRPTWLNAEDMDGHCHVNFARAGWSPRWSCRADHAACWAQVSCCQVLKASDRIAR